MKKKYILLIFFVIINICMISNHANVYAQSNNLEIIWAHNTINTMKMREDSLIDQNVLNQITDILNKRLHYLQEQGELPFTLKENDTSFVEDKTEMGSITLIPLIMDDHCFKSEYIINGQTYYKSLVMCQIDIAFCYYPGTGNNLRILHTIPLIGYSYIGDGNNGIYKSPISKNLLQNEFINNAKILINNNLNFKNKKFLKNLELKMVTTDTYQVTDVNISSIGAKKVYQDKLSLAKEMIAAAYTSQYCALHEDLTILPSLVSSNWEADAAKQTYQLSLGDSGKYLIMERANNEIKLDLTKVAAFDIPLENDAGVYKKKGYVAELKNLNDNTIANAIVQRNILAENNPNMAIYDLEGILAELLTNVSKNLAKNK